MKTFISAVALATILSTPAMADKQPIKPIKDTCGEDITAQVLVYHLDQIEMMLAEMRANILLQYPKYPKKPVDNEKAG
jgi:hypothetical protein